MKLLKRGKHAQLNTSELRVSNEQEVQRILNQTLQLTINEVIEENHKLKDRLREKEHNELILLENAEELRKKVTNLENNLEFITNQLPKTKLKLIKGE